MDHDGIITNITVPLEAHVQSNKNNGKYLFDIINDLQK